MDYDVFVYSCLLLIAAPHVFDRVISDPVGSSGSKVTYDHSGSPAIYVPTEFHYNQVSSFSLKELQT